MSATQSLAVRPRWSAHKKSCRTTRFFDGAATFLRRAHRQALAPDAPTTLTCGSPDRRSPGSGGHSLHRERKASNRCRNSHRGEMLLLLSSSSKPSAWPCRLQPPAHHLYGATCTDRQMVRLRQQRFVRSICDQLGSLRKVLSCGTERQESSHRGAASSVQPGKANAGEPVAVATYRSVRVTSRRGMSEEPRYRARTV